MSLWEQEDAWCTEGSVAGMSSKAACESEIEELSPAEAAEAFDTVARREMGISGTEFLRRWDAGEYAGQPMDEVPGLVATWMVIGLVR
jgi:hypothetical protein